MRKITLLLTMCLMCVGLFAQTNSYTRLAEFNAARTNSKVYALKTTRSPLYWNATNNELAGYWTESSQALQGSSADVTAQVQQFAFLRTENTAAGRYYMWSVAGQCFVTMAGAKSEEPVANVWLEDVTDKDNASHLGMKLYIGETGDNVVNVTYWNNNTAGGVRYNTNVEADAGNVYEFIALDDDVNLTVAMNKINQLEGNGGGEGEGEEVVDFTDKSIQIGNATNSLQTGKWYLLYNQGRTSYVSEETTALMMRGLTSGVEATAHLGKLFKFTSTGEANQYYIQSANGKYFDFQVNDQSVVTETPVAYNVRNIGSSTDCFYIQHAGNGFIADGQPAGKNFVCWETNVPSTTGGNNSYQFVEVEFIAALPSFEQNWTSDPSPWGTENVAGNLPAGMVVCTDNCTNSDVRMAEVPVTATVAGNVTITFQYTSGFHKLNILGVDLVQDGNVIYKDYHAGAAGGNHTNNVYTMNGVAVGNYTLRYYVCNKVGDHEVTQTNGTITVVGLKKLESATVDEATMNALVTLANQALAQNGVGYPKDVERETLSAAIQAATENMTSVEHYNDLQTKLAAYAATPNVNMPENGKAYTFVNKQKDGTLYYMKYAESGMTFTATATEATPFVCKVLENGKFVFVNNAGKYMVWRGSSAGTNYVKGYVDAYDTSADAWCDIELTKVVEGTSVEAGNEEALFGCLYFKGRRNPSTAANDYFAYTVIKADGTYDQAAVPFFNANFSSAIMLVEETYPNTPELKDAAGLLDVTALATFSAPFATVVPEGVTAWYASESEGEYVVMKEVDGAIPAGQGVVLSGDLGNVTMVPAAAEDQADLTGNVLVGTAGAAKDFTSNEGVYILGNKEGQVAFYPLAGGTQTLDMNKTYLQLAAGGAVVKMNFGGESTGIVAVEKGLNENAPIYDLSGRRVLNTVKGGVYIQAGRKFIVK